MNHGRDFQRLWSQLRDEVSALQARGYFGDGYWSSGTRLSDSNRVGGAGVEDYGLPEYVVRHIPLLVYYSSNLPTVSKSVVVPKLARVPRKAWEGDTSGGKQQVRRIIPVVRRRRGGKPALESRPKGLSRAKDRL